MVTTIYLVRHGETDANVQGVPQGHRDVPLNSRGRIQAEAVARWFDDRDLTAVRSSPLSRALDVAKTITEEHDVPLTEDARLVEFDQGDLDGVPISEVRERYPEFIERWRTEDPTDLRMPGGETYREVQGRIVEAIEEAAGSHQRGAVALVSHNLTIKAALCHALGVPLAGFRRLRADLAAVSIVEVEPGRWWRVTLMNEQCHLPSEAVDHEDAAR
jgi:broad specificity phosphatase PhoE